MTLLGRYGDAVTPLSHLTMSQTTLVPHSQQPLVMRVYPSLEQLSDIIGKAKEAQRKWRSVPLEERLVIGQKFMVCNVFKVGLKQH